MITDARKVHIIEINSNPCIEMTHDPIMQKLVPRMLDSAFRIAVDPVLPPPELNFRKCSGITQNLFDIVFDDSDLNSL